MTNLENEQKGSWDKHSRITWSPHFFALQNIPETSYWGTILTISWSQINWSHLYCRCFFIVGLWEFFHPQMCKRPLGHSPFMSVRVLRLQAKTSYCNTLEITIPLCQLCTAIKWLLHCVVRRHKFGQVYHLCEMLPSVCSPETETSWFEAMRPN